MAGEDYVFPAISCTNEVAGGSYTTTNGLSKRQLYAALIMAAFSGTLAADWANPKAWARVAWARADALIATEHEKEEKR